MYTCGGKCVPLCVTPDTAESCPPGVATVPCPYNPCIATTCKTGTVCVPRRCGKCTAECREIDNPAKPSPSPEPEDPAKFCIGDSLVNCLVDPCSTKNCTGNRYCASEYCGGCNAACLPRKPRCRNGKQRRPCMGTASRCILAKFGWGRLCVPDQCNDCAAVGVGPCKPGQFVNPELVACRDCPLGFACAGGSNTTVTAPPAPCNGGKFADVRGLAQCKQCAAGTTTPAKPANQGYSKCIPV
ncbi:hypothetical protein OEZ86_009850 [Tetradesmus obliquus]|uniref:TNFR-Cys domain-containing protein n=1 Tax=Tetradesmus obliquus TaxID=3088 RepID=A0ABY8UMZ1_TETOB|nr:hypothetical protein OEZ85_001288 [Tetradesmus obliquus]WIA43361.1 hypothetical protein OEZ86_009850 [Tetradesmus obliquus]